MPDDRLFADYVECSQKSKTRSGRAYLERAYHANFPYFALDNAEAFHDVCEGLRLQMVAALRREEAGPINRWRVGQMMVMPDQDGAIVGVRARAIHEPETTGDQR